jgi:hypothetical protein
VKGEDCGIFSESGERRAESKGAEQEQEQGQGQEQRAKSESESKGKGAERSEEALAADYI